MGVALHASTNPADQALWTDWYAWTVEIAVKSCFVTDNDTQQEMAREFVTETLVGEVRKRSVLSHFLFKNDHFTQTGSGQT